MSLPQKGMPERPALSPARTLDGRPRASSNAVVGSPDHTIGVTACVPV
jgi:hypothetical protein